MGIATKPALLGLSCKSAIGPVNFGPMSVSTTLLLSETSRADKLRVTEELWDDLCHSSEGVPSPAWHGEVLAARVKRVATSEAEFRDWADVRERLLQKKG